MDRGARAAVVRQEAAVLILLCSLFTPIARAQDGLLEGEFAVEFPRELIGYQKNGKIVTTEKFPTLTHLERVLGDDKMRAVMFFKLYDDEHNHFAPRFGPSGRRLAFVKADINRRTAKLRLLRLPGRKPTTILPNKQDSYDYMFRWSPVYRWLTDGQPYHAFASQAERKGDMNLYLARGDKQVRITRGAAITKHPDFHPSQPKLLYEAKGRVQLLTFSRDLAAIQSEPPSRQIAIGTQPEWSPDGKRFVYCREVGRKADRAVYEISIRSLALGQEWRIYRGPESAIVRNPTWSPDGKQIAFYRGDRKQFGWDLYLADVSRLQAKKVASKVLIENYFDDVNPAWSPTGGKLFYFSTTDQSDGYYKIHWVDAAGNTGALDYSDEFTTATDLALPRRSDGLAELTFVAVERLSQGVYVVVLNHWGTKHE